MTDETTDPEPVTAAHGAVASPAEPLSSITPTFTKQPVVEASTNANLAFIFTLIPAIWWLLTGIELYVIAPAGVGAGFYGVISDLGVPLFALWIVGMVFAHKGWRRRDSQTPVNRKKLLAALIIGYVQIIPILMAFGVLLLGVLFFGFLLGGLH